MNFSDGQINTLVRFLTNAGTITLGGLVVGSFIGQQPFRLSLFVWGVILYTAVLGLALWLSRNGKEES